MPTRVVIREPASAVSRSPPSTPRHGNDLSQSENSSLRQRSFRKSIIRKVNRKKKNNNSEKKNESIPSTPSRISLVGGVLPHNDSKQLSSSRLQSTRSALPMLDIDDDVRISSTDIRASPRLLGYLYTMIASAVMLASVAQYYSNTEQTSSGVFRRNLQMTATNSTLNGRDVVSVLGNDVWRWKLDGALIVSIAGVVVSFLLFVAHFDTVLFPHLWKTIFHDGSKVERNILLLNMLFWAAGIHICTSSLSVGASQANVYFTTWIAFAASVMTYDIWRAGANLPTLAEAVPFERDTSYTWIWVIASLALTGFSAVDAFLHREELQFVIRGEAFFLPLRDWIRALGLTFGFLALSIVVMLGNSYLSSYKVRITNGFAFEWRHFELIAILGLLGTWSWVVFTYTGVDGAINQPGNAYFGIWCTFLNTIFVLGSWMRENRTLLSALYGKDDEENGRSIDDEDDGSVGEVGGEEHRIEKALSNV